MNFLNKDDIEHFEIELAFLRTLEPDEEILERISDIETMLERYTLKLVVH